MVEIMYGTVQSGPLIVEINGPDVHKMVRTARPWSFEFCNLQVISELRMYFDIMPRGPSNSAISSSFPS